MLASHGDLAAEVQYRNTIAQVYALHPFLGGLEVSYDAVVALRGMYLDVGAGEIVALIEPAGGVHGTPDMVVEILSPSSAARDQVLKRKLYSKYGVKEYWIVNPEGQSVEVLTQAEVGLHTWQVFSIGGTLRSPLLPGLALNVDDLFRD